MVSRLRFRPFRAGIRGTLPGAGSSSQRDGLPAPGYTLRPLRGLQIGSELVVGERVSIPDLETVHVHLLVSVSWWGPRIFRTMSQAYARW